MKIWQKIAIVLGFIMLFVFIFGISGRKVTHASYLWNKEMTETLDEISGGSFVTEFKKLDNKTSYVFYIRGMKYGYMKTEYLTHMYEGLLSKNKELSKVTNLIKDTNDNSDLKHRNDSDDFTPNEKR